MKRRYKVLISTLVLLAAIPSFLLLSGSVNVNSLRMILNVAAGHGIDAPSEERLQNTLTVPKGFTVERFASDLRNARFMLFTEQGDLLVSRPHVGDVQLLQRDRSRPLNARPEIDQRSTLLSDLSRPHGIALHEGWLYIAEDVQISRVRFNSESASLEGELQVIVGDLGGDGNHWTKNIGIGPDQKLYLSQGSTCNVCVEEDERRATMMRYDLDGRNETLVATGLRNSVGFDWAPWDQALYATDNGRDMLGDDFPPCELNRIELGGFYGWPYYNADNIPDPDMGTPPANISGNPVAPAHGFRAHNAPLGMRFLQNDQWPTAFDRTALVALHGSWNRSSLDGYKVVSLHWTESGIEERDFLVGFERGGDVIGRPVDVVQGPDGAIYVSDDYSGSVYRVSYGEAGRDLVVADEVSADLPAEAPVWASGEGVAEKRAAGQALFEQNNCRSCHLPGSGKMALEQLEERLSFADVERVLTEPRPPMPRFSLSETERQALAIYLLGR